MLTEVIFIVNSYKSPLAKYVFGTLRIPLSFSVKSQGRPVGVLAALSSFRRKVLNKKGKWTYLARPLEVECFRSRSRIKWLIQKLLQKLVVRVL